ncbi:aminotransferase [Luteitalea sp. TBR-22]|uniref:pyridoxal phosphate-dependent aminotransferase n=1 Tax=Luteitalea sp. TBR-22 TaxID=2802971 RepID=UPI001AF1E72A|nr:aminotransferase class I/II-fold pyridoxal phosphate-dependent enzyme [Luteitalea sp. TBR-22]BCS31056.1 aminotransferase [Luteitalea sp. TBR-22]
MIGSRRTFLHAAAAAPALILARGREAGAFAGAVGRIGGLVRLDSNENAAGPCPAALDAIAQATRLSHVYPFRYGGALEAAIAKRQGVSTSNVLVGCGSSEILLNAVLAFTDARRGLLAPLPTFEEPARRARQLQRPVQEVPVRSDLQVDLDAMARLVPDAGLIFLCNPNNPTSVALPLDQVRAFAAEALKRNPDVVILLDEAYIEYADGGGVASALPFALETPRVVVSRTFSKMYGMAGLRVGYAMGQLDTLQRLAAWSLPMSVNTVGLHAAIASLGDTALESRERARNAEVRAFTVRRLEAAGARVPVSHANFVMADIGRDVNGFRSACAARGIAVGRSFPSLSTHARISIGTMPEMEEACSVFADVLKA